MIITITTITSCKDKDKMFKFETKIVNDLEVKLNSTTLVNNGEFTIDYFAKNALQFIRTRNNPATALYHQRSTSAYLSDYSNICATKFGTRQTTRTFYVSGYRK